VTSISDTANIISFFAGAAALASVVHLLHSQSVDRLRSLLFDLRDEMFLYAVDNDLLTNQAYRELRSEMNAFIRYAHKINATQMLVLMIASRFYSTDRTATPLVDWTMHLSSLKDRDRKTLLFFHERQKRIVAGHIVKRSLILSAIMKVIILYLKATHQAGRKENVVSAMSDHLPWRSMETEAACT
jgi:hypothetical protein